MSKVDDAQTNKFDSKTVYLTKPKTPVQSVNPLDDIPF